MLTTKFESLFTSVQPGLKILKIIKSFFINKSSSPNNLQTSIFQNYASLLSALISYLLDLSFATLEYSKPWKIAIIKPLFRKSGPLDCFNYRPISLLSTCSKYLKTVVFINFLRRKILFSNVSLALG